MASRWYRRGRTLEGCQVVRSLNQTVPSGFPNHPRGTTDQVADITFVRRFLPAMHFLQKWPEIHIQGQSAQGSKCPRRVEAKLGSTHRHQPLPSLTPTMRPGEAMFVRQSNCPALLRTRSTQQKSWNQGRPLLLSRRVQRAAKWYRGGVKIIFPMKGLVKRYPRDDS